MRTSLENILRVPHDAEGRRAVRLLAERRYSTAISAHTLACGTCTHEPAIRLLDAYFEEYITNRKSTFFDILNSEELFFKYINPSKKAFNEFWTQLTERIQANVNFDETYKGYVPTFYKSSRVPMAIGAQNVLQRITLGHRIHSDPLSSI